MSECKVAIIGAGPYGLSLAAHLAEHKIENRIFGHPMQFWRQIAKAVGKRYLKSYCSGTNISSPSLGFSFRDYNTPRNLETFEPCSMANFADYELWFQKNRVNWVEPIDVVSVKRRGKQFEVLLSSGDQLIANQIAVATGFACFSNLQSVLSSMNFGPLFRFVVGAHYTSKTISKHIHSQAVLSQ